MNRQLRKRHRITWLLMAAVIPFLLLLSWLLIPQLEPVKPVTASQPEPLSVVLKKIEHPHYELALRTNTNGEVQLEWWNKAALQVPSAVIYQLKEKGQPVLIGRIEARGFYRFPLQQDSASKDFHLQLYDFIHEKIIDTINISL